MKEFLKIHQFEELTNGYNEHVFLTFDIDWASDEVIHYCLDLLEEENISATFFVTHETPVLERIRRNPKLELGIHPNFNFLLNGDFRYGANFREVLAYYLAIVPDAVSVRSHSLVQGSHLLDAFCDAGLRFDLNLLIPRNSEIELRPIQFWRRELTRLPYFWEDDTHYIYQDTSDVTHYLDFPGMKIFNFHPIHVFLNTETLERYDNARTLLQDFGELQNHVNNETQGTRTFLLDVIRESTAQR